MAFSASICVRSCFHIVWPALCILDTFLIFSHDFYQQNQINVTVKSVLIKFQFYIGLCEFLGMSGYVIMLFVEKDC